MSFNNKKIALINYGMGNLCSVENALKFFKVDFNTTNNHDIIKSSSHLILPGVGSFRKAKEELDKLQLTQIVYDQVVNKKCKILGICLGFQMLANSSTEDGYTKGLGFIDSDVESFKKEELCGNKLTHIGFNSVKTQKDSNLFMGLQIDPDFYFVHSFRIRNKPSKGILGFTNHGKDFISSYENENIYGVQFHPEKSQSNGLKVIKNFLNQ